MPARRYCRRCGASLADAPAAARPPWWRRLFGRRTRPAPAAGERPAPRLLGRLRRPRLLVPVLVIALAATGFALRGRFSGAADTVRDRVAKAEQVHAVAVTASSAAGGHPASLAVDGTTDRYWAPARAGGGQYLEARFDQPFRLLDLLVRPGVSDTPEQFLTQARPHTLLITATDSHGRTTHRTMTLTDTPGPQRFHFPADDVVRIRVTLRTAYGLGPGRRVALAELEFFRRG